MTAGELIDTFLSVDFTFGAMTALAMRKVVLETYRNVFRQATEKQDNGEQA